MQIFQQNGACKLELKNKILFYRTGIQNETSEAINVGGSSIDKKKNVRFNLPEVRTNNELKTPNQGKYKNFIQYYQYYSISY